MNEWQPFLDALLRLLVDLGAAVLVAAIGMALSWLKAHRDLTHNAIIDAVIAQAVAAAEQLYGANQGKAKFEWVAGYLASRGIKVDQAKIEAEVHWLNKASRPLQEVAP